MTSPGGVLAALAGAAFVASAILAGATRRYALARALVDVPNDRSSHSVPTPRGGGLAIAVVVLTGIAALAAAGQLPPRLAVALGGGGALVAAVGWLDDHRDVSPVARVLVHAVAAAWTLGWLGGMPALTVGASTAHLGLGGALLAMLGLVWFTNFYNFMDGIDGLAAGEAVVVGGAATLLLAARDPSLASVAVLTAAAAAGFLVWNWPPARLFMGDVGSGFLGFLFGGLAVAAENAHVVPALLWLVLLGPLFADATITLLRRMARGERWYAAHRTHAYQRAVQAGWGHGRVAIVIVGLSLLLAPAAALVLAEPGLLGPIVTGAGVLLVLIYLAVERWIPMR